jgi:hypothetical protein
LFSKLAVINVDWEWEGMIKNEWNEWNESPSDESGLSINDFGMKEGKG